MIQLPMRPKITICAKQKTCRDIDCNYCTDAAIATALVGAACFKITHRLQGISGGEFPLSAVKFLLVFTFFRRGPPLRGVQGARNPSGKVAESDYETEDDFL